MMQLRVEQQWSLITREKDSNSNSLFSFQCNIITLKSKVISSLERRTLYPVASEKDFIYSFADTIMQHRKTSTR